jgi:muramoyltetrapeptide carboxypeptidase
MKRNIKPQRLCPGDTVGIIAPASAPPDPAAIDKSIAAIEQMGFKGLLAPKARQRLGYLAGNDRDRAGDIMRMFSNRKVRAITCIRGGYGTSRLLPRLDYKAIQANPRIFVGYSDITSLHAAMYLESGLMTFHGPMLNSDFIVPDMPEFTLKSFLRMLGEAKPYGSICAGYDGPKPLVLRKGTASGRLIGGNLTLLCAAMGTPYQPSFDNSILFIEDLSEQPYRFDRMLTQLLLSGALNKVKGIAIGINADCDDPKAKDGKEYRQTLEEVLRERLLPLKVPMVMNLPFGHVPYNATLPFGARVTLDGQKGDLFFEESAVV